MIIDVRTQEEYLEDNISGAVLLPIEDLMERTSLAEEVLRRAVDREGGKSAPIFVHCASGGRAGMACMMLTQMGFENVENWGGIEDARMKAAK